MEIKLCRDCWFFKPNGGVVSDALFRLYPGGASKLGNCDCPTEPPCGRLKNELNGCDNHIPLEYGEYIRCPQCWAMTEKEKWAENKCK